MQQDMNNTQQVALRNAEMISSNNKDLNNTIIESSESISSIQNNTTTTTIVRKEIKQKGWFHWFKADDDDEDFEEDEDGFSNKFIDKEWSDMNLFEKTLSVGEKLGYHVANILGITDSKFQVEKVEYESVSILVESPIIIQ